ncbi:MULTISPECIES: Rv3235 family protein [Microbacterium]|jgi:hypothetical protein|uniref:Rv3235 family protein n=1 Tax=Microbacterium TaxID=33882 RepID=UPI001E4B3423|nr:Rv3235 family protein [Microbacterium nymphoidis]MCD2499779.1 Rv3235 family protein [Microbacterium nymphoidis]MDR2294905.1 Rv3235 family protein [Microbacterium sp.]
MATATGAVRALQRASTVEIAEFFAPQRTSTVDLPDPAVLLRNLTVGVLESLAGVRDVDQLARWLSQEAFLSVVTRVGLATRARSARGVAAARPHQRVLCVRHSSPADGVVEGVVVVATPTRTRAVAIRLEGYDRRWRAVSLALL